MRAVSKTSNLDSSTASMNLWVFIMYRIVGISLTSPHIMTPLIINAAKAGAKQHGLSWVHISLCKSRSLIWKISTDILLETTTTDSGLDIFIEKINWNSFVGFFDFELLLAISNQGEQWILQRFSFKNAIAVSSQSLTEDVVTNSVTTSRIALQNSLLFIFQRPLDIEIVRIGQIENVQNTQQKKNWSYRLSYSQSLETKWNG